jgi:hypothetical protein
LTLWSSKAEMSTEKIACENLRVAVPLDVINTAFYLDYSSVDDRLRIGLLI